MKLLVVSSAVAAAGATSFAGYGGAFSGFGTGFGGFGTANTLGSASSWTPVASPSWGTPAVSTVQSSPFAASQAWAPAASPSWATQTWSNPVANSVASPSWTSWGTTAGTTAATTVSEASSTGTPGFEKGAGNKMYPLDYSPKTVSLKTPSDVCSQSTIRKYNLDISNADINALNADISAEEYVPCSVTTDFGAADAQTYSGSGCRYKGAVGSLLQCLDENTGKPNGSCRKLSIKVDANEFRDDDQKIDGLKRLNFHGMAVDKSLMSERLGYNLLRASGLAAPCATHVELYINKKFDGLYVFVQNVAETSFTKEHFATDAKQGKGAVYKDYWFRPDQNNDAFIKKHHKAGKKEHEFVKEATNAILAASDSDCNVMEKYFDLDSFATVTAVNDYIGQVDDWRMRHNFFWYVKDDGFQKKFVMIPWDYDRIDDEGGGLTFRRNKAGTWWRSTGFNYNSQECLNPAPDGSVAGAAYARGMRKVILDRKTKALPVDAASPIECDKITRMFANCAYDKVKSKYAMIKARFPYSELTKKMDSVTRQIQSVVDRDSSISSYEWQQGVQSMKQFLQTAPQYAPTKGQMPQGQGQQQQMGGMQLGGMQLGGMQFGGMQLGGLGGFGSVGGFGGFGGFGR